jgi:hypothetical protein
VGVLRPRDGPRDRSAGLDRDGRRLEREVHDRYGSIGSLSQRAAGHDEEGNHAQRRDGADCCGCDEGAREP